MELRDDLSGDGVALLRRLQEVRTEHDLHFDLPNPVNRSSGRRPDTFWARDSSLVMVTCWAALSSDRASASGVNFQRSERFSNDKKTLKGFRNVSSTRMGSAETTRVGLVQIVDRERRPGTSYLPSRPEGGASCLSGC